MQPDGAGTHLADDEPNLVEDDLAEDDLVASGPAGHRCCRHPETDRFPPTVNRSVSPRKPQSKPKSTPSHGGDPELDATGHYGTSTDTEGITHTLGLAHRN